MDLLSRCISNAIKYDCKYFTSRKFELSINAFKMIKIGQFTFITIS